MHYRAVQPITQPVFGIALYHEGGLWLSGPNNRFDQVSIPEVVGEGVVDYTIADLPLLNGRYVLSVAVHDESMLHPYDYHDRSYRLVVQGTGIGEHFGVIALPGQWDWRPNA
jgi:lipopolysaccharide transport system ATP-binding protein